MEAVDWLGSSDIRYDAEGIAKFDVMLGRLFPTLANNAALRADYAKCGCLLADTDRTVQVLGAFDRLLHDVVRHEVARVANPAAVNAPVAWFVRHLEANRIVCSGAVAKRLNDAAAPGAGVVKLSVSKLFKRCFAELQVDLHHEMPCSIFSDANPESKSFQKVVESGCLFVDGVATGHGDYTHMLQWLIIATAHARFGNDGGGLTPPFALSQNVGVLYRCSLARSEMKLAKEKSGTPLADTVAIWDVVLDSFVPKDNQYGDIKFKTKKSPDNAYESLFSETFRSPRFLQYALYGRVDSAKNFGYLTETVKKIDLKMHAPLLCALIANRARHKGLGIDTGENAFKTRYAEIAREKERRLKEKQIRGEVSRVWSLELDTTSPNHPAFVALPTRK